MPDDDIDASTPTPSQPQPSEKPQEKQKHSQLPAASSSVHSCRKKAQTTPDHQPGKPKKLSDWHFKRKELLANAKTTKVHMFIMVIMCFIAYSSLAGARSASLCPLAAITPKCNTSYSHPRLVLGS